jgi:hypothetical protein
MQNLVEPSFFWNITIGQLYGLEESHPLAFLHRVYQLGHFLMEIDSLIWRKLLENFQFYVKANLLI